MKDNFQVIMFSVVCLAFVLTASYAAKLKVELYRIELDKKATTPVEIKEVSKQIKKIDDTGWFKDAISDEMLVDKLAQMGFNRKHYNIKTDYKTGRRYAEIDTRNKEIRVYAEF